LPSQVGSMTLGVSGRSFAISCFDGAAGGPIATKLVSVRLTVNSWTGTWQYMNMHIYGGTPLFENNKHGLCASWDNDATNDILGGSISAFADLNRVPALDSIFARGADRLVHKWYDCNAEPDPCIVTPNSPGYQDAVAACRQCDLTDAAFEDCVFDAVCADTTPVCDPGHGTGGNCPTDANDVECSGNGDCVDGACVCLGPWSGDVCEVLRFFFSCKIPPKKQLRRNDAHTQTHSTHAIYVCV
jgi:hypothetical protein